MGFLSVVCVRGGRRKPGQSVDVERVMIRARNVKHLRVLRDQYEVLRAAEIFEEPLADYPARIIITKDVWSQVLGEIATEIDYGNVKTASARAVGVGDTAFNEALHDVWERMIGYQRESENRHR